MSVFEQNLLASIHNVHAMNDPHEVLEGLRVIKTASLDHRLRPLVRMHGGVAAILTCIIHPRPSPNAWLLLDVLETAATTLLLLICSSKHNTQACQTKRYSSWKNGKSMPAEQTNPNNTEECWYDPNTVRVVHQVCNARTLLTMLKTYPNRERLVHALSWLMLACCDIDKKTGLVARNDGGIALLLDILWTPLTLEDGTHAPRSPLSLQAPLLLLCLFTRSSESNVFAVSKANGFTILCKLTERSLNNGSSTSPMVSAAALTALSNCCRVEKMSAICGRASPAVQKAVEALEYVSNISSRSHSTAEDIEEIEVTEAALHLLYNLACSSANVPSVVAYNGIEAVHLLLNRPSNPLSLRGLCCKVCWKLLSAVRPDSTINLSKMKLFKTKNELKLKTKRSKTTSSGRRVPSKSSNHSTSTSSSVLEGGVDHPTTNSETEETKYSNNSNNQFKEEEDTRSKTAKECDCSEDEMNMMRKFPERISLYLSNNNHDNEEDDDDLHGWTRHEDNNKNTSTTTTNNNNSRKKKYSNNQQYINHVQYVLRKEMDQALSKSITGIQVAHTSEFVIPHNVLPTSSGPLGQITAHTRKNKEGDYTNDIGTPLRLHCDTNNDWVNVQQQCINRMMSLRRRTGSTDDSSYSTEIYNIDTSERPKKIATSSANKLKNVELPIDEIFELRRIARARDNQRLQRINSRSSSSSSRAAESASKYGFKCSEEEDNQKDQINLHSTRVQHHSVLPVSHHSHNSHNSHNQNNQNNPHTNDTNDTDEMGTEHPSTWTAPIVQFESRFETGNLDRAYRMGNYEYNLLISNDVNTKCCTQWYFFSVIGMLKNQKYTFNIVNLEKPASQYNSGMLPCVYSELLAEQKGKGWFRRGENVCYYQNLFTKNKGNVLGTMGIGNGKSNVEKKMPCFTLTWTDTHACNNDRVYYSYCLPYTATDMLNKVQNMNIYDSSILSLTSLTSKEAYESKSSTPSDTPSDTPTTSDDDVPPPYRTTTAHASHSSHSSHTSTPAMSSTRTLSNPGIVRRTILCYTLGTIPVPLLTITNFKSKPYEIINRKYIVLSGRVHPGESPASYMIDGVIDFLLSDTALAKELRNICVFKIVPMLNPDGVATGNHRCNLAGHDLNRQWGHPTRALSPTIYALKKLIQYQIDYKRQSGHLEYNNSNNIPSDQGIELFCDFHAHSRSFNIFTYGCESKKITIPNSDSPGSENSIIKCSGIGERIFPYLLSKLNPFFTYKECSFKIQGPKSKKANCGRVVVRKCGVLNTYTVSF